MLRRLLGIRYESVASLWLSNKKNVVTNMIAAALMWSIWKMRNDMFFGGIRGVICRSYGSASCVC